MMVLAGDGASAGIEWGGFQTLDHPVQSSLCCGPNSIISGTPDTESMAT